MKLAALRVDADSRLVQKQYLGTVEHTGRDVDAALHAPRELLDGIVSAVGQSDHGQRLVHPTSQCPPAQAVEAAKEQEIVAGGQRGIESEVLWNQTDALLHLVRLATEVESGDLGVASGRFDQPGKHPNGGRLTRTVWTEQPENPRPARWRRLRRSLPVGRAGVPISLGR